MSINLTAERLNRGLTLREAAREIGIPPATLQRAESGDGIRPGSAFKVANFYGYRVTDIWPVEKAAA
jgi:transcriptional regulator with XRE-family HTH domain